MGLGPNILLIKMYEQPRSQKRAPEGTPKLTSMGGTADVVAAAERLCQGRDEVAGFTIDGPSSLDLDDMIGIRSDGRGKIVDISIANVGPAIELAGDLDLGAAQMGFTQYRRHHNKPMLPFAVSEDALSLLPGQKRPAITISVPFSQKLAMDKPQIWLSAATSEKKFNYSEASTTVRTPSVARHEELKQLAEIAEMLLNTRREHGAIAFCDLERGIFTTEEGGTIQVNRQEIHAHIIVQEMMILANRAVAVFMSENNIPAIYRNHTTRLGVVFDRDALIRKIAQAFALQTGGGIERELKQLASTMKSAEYSAELIGHFALNVSAYMHFTSPLRRYPDLVNHRNLTAFLNGQTLAHSTDELAAIAEKMNQIILQREQETANYFRSKGKREQETETPASLDIMEPKTFSRLLAKTSSSSITESLKTVLADRLLRGVLRDPDLYFILFEVPPSDSWQELKEQIVAMALQDPPLAYSLFDMLAQKKNIEPPQYHSKASTGQETGNFVCNASFTYKGVNYDVRGVAGQKAKSAEQAAAVEILLHVMKMDRDKLDQIVPPRRVDEGSTFTIDTVKQECSEDLQIPDAKNRVQELCQQLHIPVPVYQIIDQSGPAHERTYTAVGQITIKGVEYKSDPQSAAQKKLAEKLAAQALFLKLSEAGFFHQDHIPLQDEAEQDELAELYGRTEAQQALPVDNPKGALLGYCSQNQLGTPQFFSKIYGKGTHRPVFEVVVELKSANQGSIYSGPTLGLTRKEAEHRAAYDLLTKLRSTLARFIEKPRETSGDPELERIRRETKFDRIEIEYFERELTPETAWLMEISLTASSGKTYSEWGQGLNKEGAVYEASKKVYQALSQNERMEGMDVRKGNYFGALLWYTRRNHLAAPKEKIIAEGEPDDTHWKCVCRFVDGEGAPQTREGFGSSKRLAFSNLLEQLN